MEQPVSAAATRKGRLAPWALLAVEIALGVLAVALTRKGQSPVLGRYVERVVAYAWMAVTVGGALGAYLLAARTGPGAPAATRGQSLVASGLVHLVAFAGIVAFFLVEVWPMLAVGGVAAVAGVALAFQRTAAPAGDAGADASVSTGAAVASDAAGAEEKATTFPR